MKINKDSLKARANNIAREMNISQNIVYNRFFFDAFLARLAISKYQDKFILKGGLYLSSVLGIDSRSTMDMDFCVQKLSMERESIIRIVEEVAQIDIDDGITFKVVGSTNIRLEDPYGGYQIKVLGKLENVKSEFGIDVATGDPIVPSEKNYDYKCLVTGDVLPLKVYSLETVIAEKTQTLLVRKIANSRSKDFYDLYILRKTQLGNINEAFLKKAFQETCNHRNFSITKQESLDLINELRKNEQIQTRWLAYSKRNEYAKGIEFEEIINAITYFLEIVL